MQLIVPQRRFGARSFVACIVAINLIANLAIDLYIPALPFMQREFGVTEGYLNLTMFAFFLFVAVGIVLAGPVSDQRGRRFTLVVGCIVFTASSLVCTVSPSVELLVVGRAAQAFGFGFIQVAVTAIMGDSFEGESLKLAMTIIQSITLVGPALAPFVGTCIIAFFDWRFIFGFLVVCGLLCTALALLVDESRSEEMRSSNSLAEALLAILPQCRGLLSSRKFSGVLAIFGLVGMPVASFLAVVSYIYFDFFHASYMQYNFGYAAVLAVSVVAPVVYMRLSKNLSTRRVLFIALVLTALSGVMLLMFGESSMLVFTVLFLPYMLAEGIVRPLAFVVLLEQDERLVGAASSITNLTYWVLYALSTVVATLPWPSFILAVATIAVVVAAAGTLILFTCVREGMSEKA